MFGTGPVGEGYMPMHMRKVGKSKGARDWNGTNITKKINNIMQMML